MWFWLGSQKGIVVTEHILWDSSLCLAWNSEGPTLRRKNWRMGNRNLDIRIIDRRYPFRNWELAGTGQNCTYLSNSDKWRYRVPFSRSIVGWCKGFHSENTEEKPRWPPKSIKTVRSPIPPSAPGANWNRTLTLLNMICVVFTLYKLYRSQNDQPQTKTPHQESIRIIPRA